MAGKRKSPAKFPEDRLNEAVNRHTNGESIRKIAEDFGIDKNALTRRLRKIGATVKPNRRDHDEIRTFNGKEYITNDLGYWRSRKKPRTFLHRDIFEFHTGRAIREGHTINHIDHNKNNNLFCNLEELSVEEHGRETSLYNRRLKEKEKRESQDDIPF